jgi:hypothetical protein
MITYDLQKNWLDQKATELVENVEGKGCDLVPCEECPFYIGDTSMDHNCITELIEIRCKGIECDHLCIHYVNKECITQRKDEICDQPSKYREVGDVIDALKEAEEDATMST